MVATLILYVTTFLIGSALVVCLYQSALAMIALWPVNGAKQLTQEPANDFAIVIPAYNEEQTIKSALHSCNVLDYPKHKYVTYVIADNCTDDTARVAISLGGECLIRDDADRRGKGQALEWAIPQILKRDHTAIVILDADCQLDNHALRRFDSLLQSDQRVLQANNVVANPTRNGLTYMQAVASVLENDFFYAPKSRLGLAVLLQGTGMVLHQDVLRRYPWRANSIVEDAEYACTILKGGECIQFVQDVKVESKSPAQNQQLAIQRGRWIGGGMKLAKKRAFGLLIEGLLKANLMLADAGFTLLILSRPLVVFHVLLAIVGAIFCVWLAPGIFSSALLTTALGIIVAYVLYIVIGALRLGINRRKLVLLIRLPIEVAVYVMVTIKTLLMQRSKTWQRTPREHQ